MTFSGNGSGTSGDPYQITTWGQLQEMNDFLSDDDVHFELMNDLDENTPDYDDYASENANGGDGWQPIGTSQTSFIGKFDGKEFTISNLRINKDDIRRGLFRNLVTAEVSNLNIHDIKVESGEYTGGLAASIVGSTVNNCHITEADIKLNKSAGDGIACGGLTALCVESTINNCSVEGDIVHDSPTISAMFTPYCGGFIGGIIGSNIEFCYFKGTVTIKQSISGGNKSSGLLIGSLVSSPSTITNCYTDGEIQDDSNSLDFIGGLIGINNQSGLTVSNCYIIAHPSDISTPFGSSVPLDTSPVDCFYDSDIFGSTPSSSFVAKTTEEMQEINTFTNWDIVDILAHDGKEATAIWFIDEGEDYPRLWFERGFIPPVLLTLPVSDITIQNITLNGELVEVGNEASYDVRFQYRKQGETNWEETAVNSISEPQSIDFTSDIFDRNTVYEYRIFTEWKDGAEEAFGDIETFTHPRFLGLRGFERIEFESNETLTSKVVRKMPSAFSRVQLVDRGFLRPGENCEVFFDVGDGWQPADGLALSVTAPASGNWSEREVRYAIRALEPFVLEGPLEVIFE